MNQGLQIWGLNTDSFQYSFNYNNFTAANMNAVMWSHGQSNPVVLSAGQKWGKWVDQTGSPATALNATENAHYADLVAIQVGDEQQSDIENPNGFTKAWFDAAHAGNHFADKLLYVNSTFVNDVNAYINFVASANPDAISWDAYPFGTTGVYPYNWLGKAQIFRRVALGNYIGASGTPPRPYGLYLQTYHGGDGARDPGDLEMRWQQFTAWTLGYTFVDAFTAGGGNTSLFNSGDGNSPTQPRYNQFKESARQSRNLGPALTKLISYGYGPNIILGQDASGVANAPPIDWPVFNKTNAPPNQQYLTSVSAQNLGTKNGGNPGDVYVGFFNPLLTSYGDPAGTAYFMVTNALGAYLQDPALLVSDCTQRITLGFDFGATAINSLQRLRRSDGQVEVVPLTHLSGNQYQLTFDLEGGTGDLFKYNDGTPFVGVELPPVTVYWDNDTTAGNNNLTTGGGLGGSGNWDTAVNKWYNGSSNVPWATNGHAVFWGTAGTVTLSAPQSASSLTFKTSGYMVAGSTLTMTGSSVTVDAGATATISSTVAGNFGLTKNGAGTLNLASSNSYSGATTVNAGTLQVSSDGSLGAVPGSFTAGNITLDGGTLRFGGNLNINNNRGITLGAGGGTIDTNGFTNAGGYNASQGGFRGPGDLTKIGSGTFYAAALSGGANTLWTGRLILKEGTWKINASDGLPYNVPAADGLKPAQLTLDGGTWQTAAHINVTNERRGVTVTSAGGTFDSQGFNFTWAGPWTSSDNSAVLNKIGNGSLILKSGTVAGTFNGSVNVNAGTLQLDGGTAMGDLASIYVANVANAVLAINGNETIGSFSGGGPGGTFIVGRIGFSGTLTVGGDNKSTTFGGIITGGTLNKTGSGTLTIAMPNGTDSITNTIVNGGKLLISGSSGNFLGQVTVNSDGTFGGNGRIDGSATVNGGGHLAPGLSGIDSLYIGNVTLAVGAILDFELNTVGGVDVNDRLYATYNNGLTINGGTINITNAGNMTGGIYTLISYSLNQGIGFNNLSLGTVPSGFNYKLIDNASGYSIQLEVTAPGDFNHDGTVDGSDYVVWRKGLGTKYTPADYDSWRTNFGRTYANGSGASLSSVPEPGTLALLGAGAVFVLAGFRLRFVSLSRCWG